MNIKEIRRENLRALAKSVGGITALADKLERSQSQISHLIGTKPLKNIGDRLASEIEKTFNKPEGWLDQQKFLKPHGTLIKCQEIPLFAWIEVTSGDFELPQLFALTIEDDSMQSSSGISFVKGGKAVIDRKANVENGSYIITTVGFDKKVLLRKFIKNNPAYLEANNPKYPRIAVQSPFTIYGVVRQLVYNF